MSNSLQGLENSLLMETVQYAPQKIHHTGGPGQDGGGGVCQSRPPASPVMNDIHSKRFCCQERNERFKEVYASNNLSTLKTNRFVQEKKGGQPELARD